MNITGKLLNLNTDYELENSLTNVFFILLTVL